VANGSNAFDVVILGGGNAGYSAAFERDRARHNLLVDRGWRVMRVTWQDLAAPEEWLAPLARLL